MSKVSPKYVFNLFAILGKNRGFSCCRISLSQESQRSLLEKFLEERARLLNDPVFISPAPDYIINDDQEIFRIEGFNLPQWAEEPIFNMMVVKVLEKKELLEKSIRGFLAIATDKENAKVTAFFQKSTTNTSLIKPKRGAFLFANNTFEKIEENIVLIPQKVHAIFEEGNFFYKRIGDVSPLFDMQEYIAEASNEIIKDFLSFEKFYVEDVERLVGFCNGRMRKMISLIAASGVLSSDITLKSILEPAEKANIALTTTKVKKKMRIVVPSGKREFRDFLDCLCDNFFEGPFSKVMYKSSSKRRI